MRSLSLMLVSGFIAAATPVSAKLPALSDDAKAKAADAAAKAAHGNKVADFQLCKSMDKVAGKYYTSAKAAGKDTKPATETPACADPGPFAAAAPAAAAPAAPTAPVAAAGAAPAAPKKP
jgi:hypothetical protein